MSSPSPLCFHLPHPILLLLLSVFGSYILLFNVALCTTENLYNGKEMTKQHWIYSKYSPKHLCLTKCHWDKSQSLITLISYEISKLWIMVIIFYSALKMTNTIDTLSKHLYARQREMFFTKLLSFYINIILRILWSWSCWHIFLKCSKICQNLCHTLKTVQLCSRWNLEAASTKMRHIIQVYLPCTAIEGCLISVLGKIETEVSKIPFKFFFH
jgi:phosphoribosyl-AMP cyclohydrolase